MRRVIVFLCLIYLSFSASSAISETDTSSLVNYEKLKTLSEYPGDVLSIAFSPDGKIMAAGTSKSTVILWDVARWKIAATLDADDGAVVALAFSVNGKLLASANKSKQVHLWDVTTWKKIAEIETYGNVNALSFSPDSSLLAIGCNNEKSIMWDIKSKALYKIQIAHEKGNHVQTISFSMDGKTVATGSQENDSIRIWDLNSGEKINELKGHVDNIKIIAYSKDGRYLASGGDDKLVLLWDAKTGEVLDPLPDHTSKICSLLFSPTSNILVSSDCIIRKGIFGITIRQTFGGCKNIFWDVTTAKPLKSLDSDCSLTSAAFSPDARYFVTGHAAGDQYITIYERK